jgi:hypothetical protein
MLYEAAHCACRPTSPDHQDYLALKARGLSHTRASLTIARKLARRSYHVLRELPPPSTQSPDPDHPSRPSLRPAHSLPMRPHLPASSPQRSRHPRSPWRPTKDRAARVAPPERRERASTCSIQRIGTAAALAAECSLALAWEAGVPVGFEASSSPGAEGCPGSVRHRLRPVAPLAGGRLLDRRASGWAPWPLLLLRVAERRSRRHGLGQRYPSSATSATARRWLR